jgi:hypothetical protein
VAALITFAPRPAYCGRYLSELRERYSDHDYHFDYDHKPDPADLARRSRAARYTAHWKRLLKLNSEDAAEQERATAESLAKLRSRQSDVESSWRFDYSTIRPVEGGRRKAIVIRSRQPSPESLVEMVSGAEAAGIKPEEIVVLNLRWENNMDAFYQQVAREHEDPEIRKLGRARIHQIPILNHGIPTFGQVKKMMGMIADPSVKLVLIHCEAGLARTGTVVAAMRIALDGWSVDQATGEAQSHGLSRPLQKAFIRHFAERWKRTQEGRKSGRQS